MARWRQVIVSLVAAGTLLLNTPSVGAATLRLGDAQTRIVEVRTQVTVRNLTPEAAKNLVITLPPTVATQVSHQKVLDIQFVESPVATRQTPVGLEATYRVPEVMAGATLVFEQIYTVELTGDAPGAVQERDGDRYLTAEPGIEVDHPAIQAAARAAIAGIDGVDSQAEALIRAVVDHLDYDANAISRNQGALAGYETGYGVCQEYASLFVAMSRTVGIPARLIYGWASDTGLAGPLTSDNRHVWAQYFHPERGWVSVDPTFAEHQRDLLFFDPTAHIAQGYANASMSASFGGRGLVSINAVQSLTDVTR